MHVTILIWLFKLVSTYKLCILHSSTPFLFVRRLNPQHVN
uniref:Uncharacterized protein n=1 Tax=Arundo donax TaxID=35708 RepID=A0A0A8ZRL6_ARUDO